MADESIDIGTELGSLAEMDVSQESTTLPTTVTSPTTFVNEFVPPTMITAPIDDATQLNMKGTTLVVNDYVDSMAEDRIRNTDGDAVFIKTWIRDTTFLYEVW